MKCDKTMRNEFVSQLRRESGALIVEGPENGAGAPSMTAGAGVRPSAEVTPLRLPGILRDPIACFYPVFRRRSPWPGKRLRAENLLDSAGNELRSGHAMPL